MKWLHDLVDGASRAMAFGRAPSTSRHQAKQAGRARSRARNTGAFRKRASDVHKLAAAGIDRCEIARRTRLSQDTVALLMHISQNQPEDSAARGSFFRIPSPRAAA